MESDKNFQAEKLDLIQLLLNTESAKVIKEIRALLTQSSPKALTKTDIVARAEESEQAIKSKQTLSIEELRQESKSW